MLTCLRAEQIPDPIPKPPVEIVNPDESVAETVPLPAEKPPNDSNATVIEGNTAQSADDLDSPTLTTDTPFVASGERAVFSLYGPEVFLRGATGYYALQDEFGRRFSSGVLKIQELPFAEGKPRQIALPVMNPVGQQHTLVLSLMEQSGKQVTLQSDFTVPQKRSWEQWLTLLSAPPAASDWKTLRELGIRGCVQYRMHPATREALRKQQAPFYVENVARQHLSRYHTERGLWEKTIATMSDARNGARFSREPSLSSTAFAEALAKEANRHAEAYAAETPLFYSLASEPSATRLAAAADFDFSPEAIAEFQRWLERDVYGTLNGLNRAWNTKFAAWTEVTPMTTDEARLRLKDGVMNFGPWIDFREFQDHVFAKVLRGGAEVIRRKDPAAKVGITGAMGPFAFGGWDWSRLAQALDVVECYDIGGARALWRDLAPGKPALASLSLAADTSPADVTRAIWTLALEGGRRGVILWTEVAKPGILDATVGAFHEPPLRMLRTLERTPGLLLANSTRTHDGVAILYSPASIRMQWLLEADKLHGAQWLQAWGADTSAERRESPQLRLRESWEKLLDDMGLAWRYVSSAQVERREILRPETQIKTLVLPRVIALSDQEVAVLKDFVAAGGRLVVDATCGRFDEHGRLRAKPPLDELLGVDTAAEPFYSKAMNPLEIVKPIAAVADQTNAINEHLKNLAPVFSDEPKWGDGKTGMAEYRKSPVLAANSGGVFLNLDITDYLRWRLHPDLPTARATREVIEQVAFNDRKNESLVDWAKTRLPEGTQLVWLRVSEMAAKAGDCTRVLALRRNPQERLHELGGEGDGNWAFEKAESFSLALRMPMWVATVQLDQRSVVGSLTQRIEGILDQATPSIFVLHAVKPNPPVVTAPAAAKVGETIKIKITSDADRAFRIYSVQVTGPDLSARNHYCASKLAPDGAWTYLLPLADNDSPGEWQVTIREILTGFETHLRLDITN
ncbi:MAG: alpha-amylase family protein [Planctomycetota bacterium]